MRSILPLVILALLFSTLATPAAAENWPHWRGPNLDSTSGETGLPSTWSAAAEGMKNVRWRYDLPGPASSSPIVWGERIFVTATEKGGDGLVVLAIGKGGQRLWTTPADQGSVKVFEQYAHETNAATPSPVTDGEHLWVLFGTANLLSLDAATGEVAWQADLAQSYSKPNMYFGLSTSPLLRGDRLYLQLLHTDAQLVVALEAVTGEEVWKHERPTDATGECLHSYTSVMPFAPGVGAEELLLVHGADYISAHTFADGGEVWRYGTLNPKEGYNSMFRLVSTPIASDGLVVVPTAKRGPVFGLRPGGAKGHIQEGAPQVAWKLDRGTPDVPSPLISGGLVYLSGENGKLTVLDAASGETVYAERVHQSQHRGSPVLADGKLYLTATDGTVSVLRPGRKFEILAKNQIDAGRLAASPAISGGTIYLRTYQALFAIAELPSLETNTAGPDPGGAD